MVNKLIMKLILITLCFQNCDDLNVNRDVYVPNPSCKEFNKYEWIGQLMGACLRGKEKLVLTLPTYIWKKLVGERVSWKDYSTVDAAEVRMFLTPYCSGIFNAPILIDQGIWFLPCLSAKKL